MTRRLPRSLLAASALILAFGGLVHAKAFTRAASAAASSNLPSFYANALKGLWLIDSATLVLLAIVFGLITIRPTVATGSVIVLLALVPAATAALLYTFIGRFTPAHMLLVASLMAAASGLLWKRA